MGRKAKLDRTSYFNAKKLHTQGMSIADLADHFEVTASSMYRILRRGPPPVVKFSYIKHERDYLERCTIHKMRLMQAAGYTTPDSNDKLAWSEWSAKANSLYEQAVFRNEIDPDLT